MPLETAELPLQAAADDARGGYRGISGKRDLRLDMLRGAAMVAMIVDHIGGQSSWLYYLSGGNRFFVSAAECFIFLSGLVTGIVYTASLRRDGLGAGMLKILRRGVTLYMLAVVVGIGLPVAANLLSLPWPQPLTQGPIQDFIVSILTLHRTYYLADIMLLYTLLFPCAALALALIAEGRWALVLAGSWTLWLVWQRWPKYAEFPWQIDGNTVFHFAAWQALFFTALVLGAERQRFERWISRVPVQVYLGLSSIGLVSSIALYRSGLAPLQWLFPRVSQQVLQDALFSKPDVRIGRVIVFIFLATFAFSLLTVAWQPLSAMLGWLLLPLGQGSLTAYTLHLGLAALVTRFSAGLFDGPFHSAGQNALIQLSAVMAVWLIIRLLPILGNVAHALDKAEHTLLDEAATLYFEAGHLLDSARPSRPEAVVQVP